MTSPRDVARDDQRIALGRDIGRTDPTTAVSVSISFVAADGEGRPDPPFRIAAGEPRP